jgi:hypothetical protein
MCFGGVLAARRSYLVYLLKQSVSGSFLRYLFIVAESDITPLVLMGENSRPLELWLVPPPDRISVLPRPRLELEEGVAAWREFDRDSHADVAGREPAVEVLSG